MFNVTDFINSLISNSKKKEEENAMTEPTNSEVKNLNHIVMDVYLDEYNRICFNFYIDGVHTSYENIPYNDRQIINQMFLQGTLYFTQLDKQLNENASSEESKSKKHPN